VAALVPVDRPGARGQLRAKREQEDKEREPALLRGRVRRADAAGRINKAGYKVIAPEQWQELVEAARAVRDR
jgi:hypothetical protein